MYQNDKELSFAYGPQTLSASTLSLSTAILYSMDDGEGGMVPSPVEQPGSATADTMGHPTEIEIAAEMQRSSTSSRASHRRYPALAIAADS